jgi:hypothetical protein
MVIIAILLGEIMKNRFLLLVNKLWQKQQLFIPKMNHFLWAHPILIIKAMDVVGDRVFAVTSRTVEVDVYDTETGATLTTLSRRSRGGRREWLD